MKHANRWVQQQGIMTIGLDRRTILVTVGQARDCFFSLECFSRRKRLKNGIKELLCFCSKKKEILKRKGARKLLLRRRKDSFGFACPAWEQSEYTTRTIIIRLTFGRKLETHPMMSLASLSSVLIFAWVRFWRLSNMNSTLSYCLAR